MPPRHFFPLGFLLLLGALAGPQRSEAGPMRVYTFRGTLASIDDEGSLLHASMKAGDPFSATMIIDPGVPDTVPDPSEGKFSFRLGTGTGIDFQAGGLKFGGDSASGPMAVRVFDRPPLAPDGDVLTGYQFGDPIFDGAILSRVEFALVDPTGTALAGGSIPAGLDLSGFTTKYVNAAVFFDPTKGPSLGISGRIESVEVTSVPEPTTLLAMTLLVAGLFLRQRHASRKLMTP